MDQPDPGVPALDDLLPLILDELRVLAHRQLAREHGPVSLQTTELVHEAYLRLSASPALTAKGRTYFFAAAGRAMRQVLVDAARRRSAAKRGGGLRLLSLDTADGARPSVQALGEELLALDAALDALAADHPRLARVVECRFFGGLSVDDTAAALGVSPRTVKADWAMARAWLHERLAEDAA